jgi:methionyl-tRNA formyltransferase
MSYRSVFMGSSEFSVAILEELAKHYTVNGVITQPDKPAGRGKQLTPPPVKIAAQRLGLPFFQPEKLNDPVVIEQLTAWAPDFIVVAAYGKILRQNVLDLPRYGCVNVHASFLPRWRGASPIQTAILHGDETTGVTIMVMDAGVDTGAILSQQMVPIETEDDAVSLSAKLAAVGGPLLVHTLDRYLAGAIQPQSQPDEGMTYAAMIRKEDGILDFTQPAALLERKVRAFIEWPGASLAVGDEVLKVRKARVIPGAGTPGSRTVIDRFPCVETPDGKLVLLEVKPAGKNWMSGADYLRGARNW